MIRYVVLLLAFLCTLDLSAADQAAGFTLRSEEKLPVVEEPLSSNSKTISFVYGSLSVAPGVGLSMRTTKGSIWHGVDLKVGFPLALSSGTGVPPICPSLGYECFYSFNKIAVSPYVSTGIGATVFIIPYVPLRVGFQSDKGFIDIGARMLFGIVPSPELRAGLSF